MKRELYDIWEEADPLGHPNLWRCQLINFIASFPSQEYAERYVAAVKKTRKELGLK
jgi:hypothetical protein